MGNNVHILRVFIMLSFLAITGKVAGQASIGIPLPKNNCLFGYISDNPKEFEDVVDYLAALNLKVISTCDEEFLIYVELNERYKDYTVLFAKIERMFTGICYYKSDSNDILLYPKCAEKKLKENLSTNHN